MRHSAIGSPGLWLVPEAGGKSGLLLRGPGGTETPGGLGRGQSPDQCNTGRVRAKTSQVGGGNQIWWGCGGTVLKEVPRVTVQRGDAEGRLRSDPRWARKVWFERGGS